MTSDAFTLLVWDPLLAASDLKAHSAGSPWPSPSPQHPSHILFSGTRVQGGGSFITCHPVSLGHCPCWGNLFSPSTCQLMTFAIPLGHVSAGPSSPKTLTAAVLNCDFVKGFGRVHWAGLTLSTLTDVSSPSPLGPARQAPGSFQGPCPFLSGALCHGPRLVFPPCFWLISGVSPPLPLSPPLDWNPLDAGSGRYGLCALSERCNP